MNWMTRGGASAALQVRDERENRCDDVAVAISGGDRVSYGATLLILDGAPRHGAGIGATLIAAAPLVLAGANVTAR